MSNIKKETEALEITKIIREIFKKENSVVEIEEEVEVLPGCQPTGNFVTEVLRVRVKGRKISKGIINGLEKTFILKKLPSPNSLSHIFHDCVKMFNNEISAYEKILPKMQSYLNKLPENVQVPELSFPLYFGHFENRFLLLQDLQEKGYQVVDLVKGCSTDECYVILEHLAKFHAVSFALKFSGTTKLEYMTQEIEETNFGIENQWRDKILSLWDLSLLLALQSLKDSKDPRLIKHANILENFTGKVFAEMMHRTSENVSPMQVFSHGDLWTNNILLRYDGSNNNPVSVKFIDLQGMRYSSCALDVVQFLFTSANPQKDFLKLIRHYYYALEKNLTAMNEGPLPFTLDDFLDEIERKLIFGTFYAFLLFTSMTNEPLQLGDDLSSSHLSNPKELKKVYEGLKPEYHERVRGLILAIAESTLMWK